MTTAHHEVFRMVSLRGPRGAQANEPDGGEIDPEISVIQPDSGASMEDGRQSVTEHHRQALRASATVEPSGWTEQAQELEAQYEQLTARYDALERLEGHAHRTYAERKRASIVSRPLVPGEHVPGRGGVFSGLIARVLARFGPLEPSPSVVSQPLTLNEGFYQDLTAQLPASDLAVFDDVLGAEPPGTIDGLLAALDTVATAAEANRLCSRSRRWVTASIATLPEEAPADAGDPRPLVRSVGWGDLVVARERLAGYEAREVAHIENVMPGETRLREHERTNTTELITERETVTETESERDLQTTERFELQTQAQRAIEQEFSVEAGVNTSGRYGLTKVSTSLRTGFQQSKSQSRSSAQTVAREVVARAVERTFERVRERRQLTVTNQVRELNRHQFANTPDDAPAADVSGVYLWVEKLLEVELRHYGTRLMVEFYLPEPAVSLLERASDKEDEPHKPAPFTLNPAEISPTNYLCLAAAYDAQDIQPPPAQFVKVGFGWASAPSEDVDEDTAEDTFADTITVPAVYQPVDAYGLLSAHPAKAQYVDAFLAVGGLTLVHARGVDFDDGEAVFDPSVPWPSGVPVSLRAHGHFDKTLTAQVALRCRRTDEAMTTWRLRVWEALRKAHEVRMQAYRSELEAYRLEKGLADVLQTRPAAENKRVEQAELRKWAIKAMRRRPFNFDAIEQVGDFQEIDPLAGDLLARVAGFFEEAFEWDQASYILHPYFWGRRDTWDMRAGLSGADAGHIAFLSAGAARYIVPVTPGHEDRVLFYLDSHPDLTSDPAAELALLDGPPEGEQPAESDFEDLWLELLLQHQPDMAAGSGTLAVTGGQTTATVNADSNWRVAERDLGRELFIDGGTYIIAAAPAANQLTLDRPYEGVTDPAVRYATGSVPYGAPWLVRVPTSLVVLSGSTASLPAPGA